MVFHSDLDNTLIYSYKRGIGGDKRCVEIYQGREISYMTERSVELLRKVREQVVFVPTTTRTAEQYRRVWLGEEPPEYALVCNGGILLAHGERVEEWYGESRELVADCRKALEDAQKLLGEDGNVTFEIRDIEGLFVFTKSAEPGRTVGMLKNRLRGSGLDVFSNGMKVYAVPKALSKGEAVRRFRHWALDGQAAAGGGSQGAPMVAAAGDSRLRAPMVIAAGDSRFDISMLEEANVALAERGLEQEGVQGEHVVYLGEEGVFSDEVLGYILQLNTSSLEKL